MGLGSSFLVPTRLPAMALGLRFNGDADLQPSPHSAWSSFQRLPFVQSRACLNASWGTGWGFILTPSQHSPLSIITICGCWGAVNTIIITRYLSRTYSAALIHGHRCDSLVHGCCRFILRRTTTLTLLSVFLVPSLQPSRRRTLIDRGTTTLTLLSVFLVPSLQPSRRSTLISSRRVGLHILSFHLRSSRLLLLAQFAPCVCLTNLRPRCQSRCDILWHLYGQNCF